MICLHNLDLTADLSAAGDFRSGSGFWQLRRPRGLPDQRLCLLRCRGTPPPPSLGSQSPSASSRGGSPAPIINRPRARLIDDRVLVEHHAVRLVFESVHEAEVRLRRPKTRRCPASVCAGVMECSSPGGSASGDRQPQSGALVLSTTWDSRFRTSAAGLAIPIDAVRTRFGA